MYRDVGDIKDCILLGHGDAGAKTLPDKATSVGGQVVFIFNRSTKEAAIIHWKSKKLKRKVMSSTAGEYFAMTSIIGQLVYMRLILARIYGDRMLKIPTRIWKNR